MWYFISKVNSYAFEDSDPLKSSPGSHSQSVSCSVVITSSCSLLAFLLSVSLMSSHVCCHCSLTRNCARLLITATPVLKAVVKLTTVKLHGNNLHEVMIAHIISGDTHTNQPTDTENEKQF